MYSDDAAYGYKIIMCTYLHIPNITFFQNKRWLYVGYIKPCQTTLNLLFNIIPCTYFGNGKWMECIEIGYEINSVFSRSKYVC